MTAGHTRPRAAISWSGGKDGCLALMRAWPTVDVCAMLTMFDEAGARSRSHGLRPEIIAAQAERLRLTVISEGCTWPTYEAAFGRGLARVAALGCTHVIFGDIFEDAHRQWTDRLCAEAGLVAMQPLWGESTAALVDEFIERGGVARLVTVRESYLDPSWLGRALTREHVAALTTIGVDPCGERGEYHTLVTDCPLFAEPLRVAAGVRVFHGGCWAEDLTPEAAHAAV
jgi:diphthine-ammonia ligase